MQPRCPFSGSRRPHTGSAICRPNERPDQYAAELIQLKPNVIVAQTRAVFSVRRAGGTMPVVFGFSGDPVLAKLAGSLARPDGNFTGLSMLSLDLTAKRMELLKELIPQLKRVAIIANPASQVATPQIAKAATQTTRTLSKRKSAEWRSTSLIRHYKSSSRIEPPASGNPRARSRVPLRVPSGHRLEDCGYLVLPSAWISLLFSPAPENYLYASDRFRLEAAIQISNSPTRI